MPHAFRIRQAIFRAIYLALAMAGTALAQPTTKPASAVQGKVSAEGDVPLSEMIVYLESPDPNRPLPAPPPAVRVTQKGAQFEPRMVVVTVGQSVDFPNDEDRAIEHNVFSNSAPKRFDLGLYKPGESRTVIFDKPGPVFLYCSIHRYMDGVIFVSPTPYTSRVEADGRYTIPGVPAGAWIVKTWQRRKRFPDEAISVELAADHPAVVNLALKRK